MNQDGRRFLVAESLLKIDKIGVLFTKYNAANGCQVQRVSHPNGESNLVL